jgi:hypothetical protein
MNLTQAKPVVLDMAFRNRALYDRFTRDVQEDSTITPNILRGRVAPDGAWMRLELRGASRRIKNLVGRWKDVIIEADRGPEVAA